MSTSRGWSWTWGVALVALLLVTPSFAQDVDECSSPAAPVDDLTPVSDVLTVVGSITIDEARIPIDITHTWIGDLTIDVTSPAATTVNLHAAVGGAADNMLLTFADAGQANDPANLNCGCLMQTSGGTLADFNLETSDGDWTLDVADGAAGDAGTVNEWCVQAYEVGCPGRTELTCTSLAGDAVLTWTLPGTYTDIEISRDGTLLTTLPGTDTSYTDTAPGFDTFDYTVNAISADAACDRTLTCSVTVACPVVAITGLTCTPAGFAPSDIDLAWVNNGDYSEIDVARDGVSIATLPGGDLSYTDLALAAGTYVYTVTPTDGICDGGAATCTVTVTADLPAFDDCNATVVDILDLATVTSDIDILTSEVVNEVEVTVDITHTFQADLNIRVVSPAGTTGELLDGTIGGAADDVFAVFTNNGVPTGSLPLTCACEQLPTGSMSVWNSEDSLGIWTMEVEDDAGGDTGTLNEWCIEPQGCPTFAPSGVTCSFTDPDVTIDWTNESTYDAVEVYRNGTLLVSLDGTETTHTDLEVPNGLQSYVVRGVGPDCGADSTACLVEVGLVCADIVAPIAIEDDADGSSVDIDVIDEIDLTDLNVLVEMNHTWMADVTIRIESPSATAVTLYDGNLFLDFDDNMNSTFSENGEFIDGTNDLNAGGLLAPSGPGRLSDFRDETTAIGLWTATYLDDVAGFDFGEIVATCLSEGCEVEVPDAGIACTSTGSDVTITWTNPAGAAYTAIDVLREGVVVGSLTGGEESFDDLGAPAGILEYTVVYTDAVIGCSNSWTCSVAVGLGFCNTEQAIVDDTATVVTTVTGAASITDPVIAIEFTHLDTDTVTIDLTSPDGTTILLFDHFNLFGSFFTDVPFRDGGVDLDTPPFLGAIQPREPLSTFAGEDPNGDWTLTVTGLDPASSGFVNAFCVNFGDCALEPPTGLTCTATDSDVDLAWTNNDTYDSVEIYRDGALLSTELGGAEIFTDFGVPDGVAVYQVVGVSAVAGCDAQSTFCTAVVGDIACNTERGNIIFDLTRVVEVLDDVLVSDAAAAVDITHDFAAPEITIDLTSPSFTTVTLATSPDAFNTGIDATFGGGGVPFLDGGLLDIDGAEMVPSGPGSMADFDGDGSLGDWTFEITDTVAPGLPGIFNSACINPQRCTVGAPTAFTCTPMGDDIDLSWVNASAYGEIRVVRNGDEVAVIDGAESTFTDIAPGAGFHVYQIFGTDAIPATCERASESCQTQVGFTECSGAGELITAGAPVVSDLTITATGAVLGVEALLEMTHTFQGDVEATLDSPSGDQVMLLDELGGIEDDFAVIISDDGVAAGSITYNCLCRQMPALGTMADFGGDADGTWTLTVTDVFAGDDGTLDNWCLEVETCDLAGPSELLCTVDGNDAILDWANNDTYDELVVSRDGVEVAILGGSETTYTDMPGAGLFTYTVTGNDATLGCGSGVSCMATVGLVCDAPDLLISSTLPITTSTIEVTDADAPDDLLAVVDLTHTWVGDITIDLENPDSTATRLFDTDNGNMNDDLSLTFADSGTALDVTAAGIYDTGETVMPTGPGTMLDLAGGTLDGTWTLTITDEVGGDDGNLASWCLNLPATGGGGGGPTFIRGDCDGNGIFFGLLDALYLLQFSFTGGPALPCEKAGDADGNDVVFGLLDALYILQFAFTGGPAPGSPFPDCGTDTSDLSPSVSCDMGTCTP